MGTRRPDLVLKDASSSGMAPLDPADLRWVQVVFHATKTTPLCTGCAAVRGGRGRRPRGRRRSTRAARPYVVAGGGDHAFLGVDCDGELACPMADELAASWGLDLLRVRGIAGGGCSFGGVAEGGCRFGSDGGEVWTTMGSRDAQSRGGST